MKRLLMLLALCLGLTVPALADEVLRLTELPEEGAVLETACSSFTLTIPAEPDTDASMTVTGAEGPVWQRSWSGCSGSFTTQEIPLKLEGVSGSYSVTVCFNRTARSFTLCRTEPALDREPAWAAGVPLQRLTGSDTQETVVMLDASRDGVAAAALQSGGRIVGTVRLTVSGGCVTVTAEPSAGITVDSLQVQVAVLFSEAVTFEKKRFSGTTAQAGEPVALRGAATAVVRICAEVSGEVTGLPEVSYEISDEQQRLLERFLNESYGLPNG